ncbi:type IV toxin-antitoxin system AbiEi family antitoxin [Flavobacterium sp. ENC]|uniref:type IV toxin-antitoxin system AbiEi family antitoxin domain-containing protein n=1 Tax=Flavobacterium sp. ENC TaxID=2897330 RepID=UPI001E616DF7|nr:type IV toxin-antitoxin system AbiEi family antitoxin [Flavobacterium sp. ENC]MCD0464063.1 type IV toxin-antitoxin system AbiEi family antitoxin [Flavobacterium sp. ENC]
MSEAVVTYNYLDEYLDELRSKGRYAFTLDEAKERFPVSDKALNQNLYRLKKKKKIVQVRKGFYTLLPAEYSHQGIIPVNMFIDDMMKALGKNYYVGLVSAAALHGAGHQQPMETFIITERPALRDIKNKKLKLNFFIKNEWNKEDVNEIKTEAGYMNVSSPELTALDLLYYAESIGMNRILTILEELVEAIRPTSLKKTAKYYSQTAAIQRLGYLLEVELENEKLAEILYRIIADRIGVNIPLMPGKDKIGETNPRWKIIRNVEIESDL